MIHQYWKYEKSDRRDWESEIDGNMLMTYDEGHGQVSDPGCSAGMEHHDILLLF